MNAKTRARFEAKIDRSGGPDACHLWIGWRFKKGYGGFRLAVGHGKRRDLLAHRVALELSLGRALCPGMCALHSCPGGDNPACCNPKHLREGTKAQNAEDREERGRTARGAKNGARLHPDRLARGEKHGRAVMTEAKVRKARAAYAKGELCLAIGARLGVSEQVIRLVVKRRTWKHVP